MSANEGGKLWLILAALGGGLAGGLLVWLLTRPPAASLDAVADTTLVDAGVEQEVAAYRSEPLDRRVSRLERQLALLKRQQRSGRPPVSRGARASSAAEGPRDVEEPAPPAEGEQSAFEKAVRDVIDRSDRDRRQARRTTRQERREDRARRQVDYLSERLGLSEDQIEKLDGILIEQSNAMRALHRPPDGGVRPATRVEFRAQAKDIRDDTREELAKVLSDTQLTEYDKWQEEERGDRGRHH